MDVDPVETVEKIREQNASRLNTYVALTVAIIASFTGICKVKDDNLVQTMEQAQADKIDHWSWYQALHIREETTSQHISALTLGMQTAAAPQQELYKAALKEADARLSHLDGQKKEMETSAKADQEKYDALNYRDDQFDLSDAMLAIAISLLAITALVQKRWLYVLALVPSGLGILMGLSGLMGWHIHPDTIVVLLS